MHARHWLLCLPIALHLVISALRRKACVWLLGRLSAQLAADAGMKDEFRGLQ
jgi:hypothetical protein